MCKLRSVTNDTTELPWYIVPVTPVTISKNFSVPFSLITFMFIDN